MNCTKQNEQIIFHINDKQVILTKENELIGDLEEVLMVSNLLPWTLTYQNRKLEKNIQEHFHTYEEVAAFIAMQKDRVYSLDNFAKFMNAHGNLQNALACIHICGTNGKGSTSNYIRDVLENSHYHVGLFTSPALQTRLEIIQVDHKIALEERIVRYCNYYIDAFLKYEISLFEIEMFLSILYFIESRVDFCIYEVGLGGELDATNIIMPKLCINTNISYDHMNYLGNTLEEIAQAKAGIIKEGVPFLTGETKKECLAVFEKVCQQKHSELLFVKGKKNINGSSYDYENYHFDLEMLGSYQIDNSALAIEALLLLRDRHIVDFEDEVLVSSINHSHWPGRFEKVCDDPLIIIDGAHNEDGMKRFYESAQKYKNPLIIFSALRDKDTSSMIEYLLRLSNQVIVTEFEHYRAATAEQLAKDYPVTVIRDYKEALEKAYQYKGVVLITGSLYFISKVRSLILEKGKV